MHSHCRFSPDSSGDPEENIKNAIKNKIRVLAFTDHMERFYHNKDRDFTFDVGDYFSHLGDLKKKYKDQIEVLIGVEIGLGLEIAPWVDQFIEETPFDLVIGSIHSVYEEDISWNRTSLNQDPEKWYRAYYQTMLDCTKKTKNFHILGHIDYIDRYIEDKRRIPPHENFQDIIDEILLEIIGTNRGIEYNLAGLRKNLSYGNPKDQVLKRYLKLGGDIITISTDAHSPASVGKGIYQGIDHLRQLGFKRLALRRKRDWDFIPI